MMMIAQPRRRGRPSVAAERRSSIVNAFIELMGQQATTAIPMTDVAHRAGVSRTAVAHFVGDRPALHTAAVDELRARYEQTLRSQLGPAPTVAHFLDVLFSDDWALNRTTDDRAFDALVAAATFDAAITTGLRQVYDLLIGELAAAIRRSRQIDDDDATGRAYAIVCIAEFNSTLLALGYEPVRSRRARTNAERLLA